MTKTQITHFLTLARELNFTRSANSLYISQPAISKSISTLEAELGFLLFVRRDNGLELTSQGRRLAEFMSRALGEYDALVDELRAGNADPKAPVRVGCPETWNPNLFMGKINDFQAKNPEIEVVIESCRLSELLTRLRAGKLDAILTHELYSLPVNGLKSEIIAESICGILYSRRRFPRVTSVAQFKNEDFFIYDNDIEKRFAGLIRSICLPHGFDPRIRASGALPTALFDVSCGKGVMLFSDWDLVVQNDLFAFFPTGYSVPVKLIYSPEKMVGVLHELVRILAE